MPKVFPYTLDALPISGVTDATQSVADAHNRLNATLILLDRLLQAPYGYTVELRQAISSVRFWVSQAIETLDAWVGNGHSQHEPASNVTNLVPLIDQHLSALQAAKGLWHTWLPQVWADAHDDDVVPVKSPVGLAMPAPTTALQSPPEFAKSLDLGDYFAIAGVALAGYLLWRVIK